LSRVFQNSVDGWRWGSEEPGDFLLRLGLRTYPTVYSASRWFVLQRASN